MGPTAARPNNNAHGCSVWLYLIEYLYFVIADNYRNSYKNNKNTEVYKSIKQ